MEVGEQDIAMQTCKFCSKSKWFRTWLFPGAGGTGARGHGGRGWAGEGRAVFASVSKEKVKSPYNLVDKMVCTNLKQVRHFFPCFIEFPVLFSFIFLITSDSKRCLFYHVQIQC